MDIIMTFGYSAAILTTASFLPQAIKTWREKDTKGISLVMYSMFTLGVFFWALYGFLTWDLPILGANTIALILASIILTLKIKHG